MKTAKSTKRDKRVHRNKRRSHTKKGGASVVSGHYGCIFRPPLVCENESDREPNSISKVFYEDNEYRSELAMLEGIRRIDPDGKYTTTFIRSCKTKPLDIRNREDSIQNCNPSRLRYNNSYYQIIMPDGGSDLFEFRSFTEEEFSKALKDFGNLFDAIILFKNNRLSHFDIRLENILYDRVNPMKLIDFGLNKNVDAVVNNLSAHIYSNDNRIDNTSAINGINYWYPFDLQLLTPSRSSKSLEDFEEILATYKLRLNKLNSTNSISLQYLNSYDYNTLEFSLKDNINQEITKYIINRENLLRFNPAECLLSVDTYSLGQTLYLFILVNKIELLFYVETLSSQLQEILEKLIRLSEKMTHPIYVNRISAEQARDEYYSIIGSSIIGSRKRDPSPISRPSRPSASGASASS